MEDINISVEEKNGWSVLLLQGRLDRVNAENIGSKAEEIMNTSIKMAADLSGLKYISSAGIRVLLRLAKKSKAEGKEFVICGADGFVKEILEDSNMDVLVTMINTVEQLT